VRSVRAKKFGDYFRREGENDFNFEPGFDWDQFFYHRRTRFNRQWVLLFLLIGFAVTAFWSRVGVVLFLTETLSLAGLFFRTRAVAMGLYVIRRVPNRARKSHNAPFEYEIRNASEFAISHFWIRDFFTGTKRRGILVTFLGGIPALSIRKQIKEVICDAGMGVHSCGPLVATITDPFGIFEFTVKVDDLSSVQVLPDSRLLDGFRILDSLDSSAFGMSESVRAGHSANFLGLREYVPGDSIRRINWKVSARHRSLVVNMYESMVHTDLTVVVDMGGESHIGRAGDNTWEMAKEATISILHDLQPRTHRIQLFSQNVSVPFERGLSHLLHMSQVVANLEPTRPDESGIELLRKSIPNLPYGSSLIYVAPIYQNDSLALAQTFAMLVSRAIRCVAVFVQAEDYVLALPPGLTRHVVSEKNREAVDAREALMKVNAQIGVATYLLVRGRPLVRSLSRPVVGTW